MKYYITTPIYYVNDAPHIGHAYTTIMADVLARWHRLNGDNVFFLTGTDEHGEKVAEAAKKAGKNPKEFADSIVQQYSSAWKSLNISYDRFIRTTDPKHADVVSGFLSMVLANGDIYKGNYEGWYCVPDETFWTELQLRDGKCPECGREVKWLAEESYFFRLSKYRDRLLAFYSSNPDFLSPQSRANEILNRVKGGLKDLSVSRTTISWAIPFPSDSKHYVYVWVDALINYISALGWPDGTFNEFWPADLHLVGKEINWFHSVIWPALLLSAGLEPPKKVFSHGWWTVDGRKMSKSLGNFVNPLEMAGKYSVDALRYFLVRTMPMGSDGDFSETALAAAVNGELVADLGNLIYRVLSLVEKHKVSIKGAPELESSLQLGSICRHMESLEVHGALNGIWDFVRSANRYINEKRAWELEGERLGSVLYNLLESCRIIAILVSPFMPETSAEINRQLDTNAGTLRDCVFREFTGTPRKGKMLFQKVV